MNNLSSELFTLLNNHVVLHESDLIDSKEHYFLLILKNNVQNFQNFSFLKEYQEKFSIPNISKKSKDYIKNHSQYFFIYLDSLDRNDIFFKENEKILKQNIDNIISLKSFNKIYDIKKMIHLKTQNYFSKFLILSNGTQQIIKQKIKKVL
jgi:hypothetical protein